MPRVYAESAKPKKPRARASQAKPRSKAKAKSKSKQPRRKRKSDPAPIKKKRKQTEIAGDEFDATATFGIDFSDDAASSVESDDGKENAVAAFIRESTQKRRKARAKQVRKAERGLESFVSKVELKLASIVTKSQERAKEKKEHLRRVQRMYDEYVRENEAQNDRIRANLARLARIQKKIEKQTSKLTKAASRSVRKRTVRDRKLTRCRKLNELIVLIGSSGEMSTEDMFASLPMQDDRNISMKGAETK